MSRRLKCLCLGIIICVPAYPVLGDPAAPGGKPGGGGARISLVPIGDVPEPKYDLTPDGKRVFKETPESETPPLLLYYREGGKLTPLNLGLNSPAATIRYDGAPELSLFATPKAGAEPFIKVAIPATKEDTTVFMVRNPETKSWRKAPLVKVYENGLKSFPKNSLRILNFSKVPITFQAMKGEATDVPASTPAADVPHLVPLPPAEQGILQYKITTRGEGAPVVIAETATTYPADARINLVAYDVDGDDKTKPVKIVVYFELPYKDAASPGEKGSKGAKPPVKR